MIRRYMPGMVLHRLRAGSSSHLPALGSPDRHGGVDRARRVMAGGDDVRSAYEGSGGHVPPGQPGRATPRRPVPARVPADPAAGFAALVDGLREQARAVCAVCARS